MSDMFQGKDDTTVTEMIPEALRFGGALKSSVVTNKSSVRMYPVGNQEVNSLNGSKQILFRIASSEYLQPSTACLNFTCHVGHKNIYMQDLATSLIDAVTLYIGGVEVEHIQNVDQLTKLLINHSVPKSTYERTYQSLLGAWKYVPKGRTQVGTSVCKFTEQNLQENANLEFAGGNLTPYSGRFQFLDEPDGTQVYGAVEGQLWSEDSFPIADPQNELFSANGRDFSIPLHLLLGTFRLSTLLPVWAMGSIDLKIDFNNFNNAMLLATGWDKGNLGVVYPERDGNEHANGLLNDATTINALTTSLKRITDVNDKYYRLSNMHLTLDFLQCDSSYNTLLASLISSSSITLPIETYSTVQRNFIPGSQNQLLISRGVSYLKQAFCIMRPVGLVSNPYYMNDGGRYGDIFKSIQWEIGSKIYHPAKIDSLQACLRERDIVRTIWTN